MEGKGGSAEDVAADVLALARSTTGDGDLGFFPSVGDVTGTEGEIRSFAGGGVPLLDDEERNRESEGAREAI